MSKEYDNSVCKSCTSTVCSKKITDINKKYKLNKTDKTISKEYEVYKKKINEKSAQLKKEIDIYHRMMNKRPDNKNPLYTANQKEEIKEILVFILPHGSGIDCEWNIEFCKNGTILCKNFFHAMNDNGYYVKWFPISIRIYRHKKNIYRQYGINEIKYQIISEKGKLNWDLKCTNTAHYGYMLKDSLFESFNEVLKDLTKWELKSISPNKFKKPYTIE